MASALDIVMQRIRVLYREIKHPAIYVPTQWYDPYSYDKSSVKTDPFHFFEDSIFLIKSPDKTQSIAGCTYNMMIRYSTAFDHYNDGKIENKRGRFKSSGTFLKAIAMLRYIKSLRCDTIHLLPITSIGSYGKKGDLGSPYAINNHYSLDENLGEDLLQLPIELQFEAFVEAAHLLDIKVICEFVFRTAAIDSELAIEHPDWFYWVKTKEMEGNFTPPSFEPDTLEIIKSKIEINDFEELPVPSDEYISKYAMPVGDVRRDINTSQLFSCNEKGESITIPGAFADWPPDDTQPLWSDVSYLRLFDSKDYNYMSYNTLRMYDKNLDQTGNANKELHQYLENIIPYYIKAYDIDGVMVDMGHALPEDLLKSIIAKAKEAKPDLMLREENFSVNQCSFELGYEAAIGYLPFDFFDKDKLALFLSRYNSKMKYFATTESHNTPRTKYLFPTEDNVNIIFWFLTVILGGGIPYIHSGFELNETTPVNTGLGFSEKDMKKFPVEKLPLFSTAALDWSDKSVIKAIHKLSKIVLEKRLNNCNITSVENLETEIMAQLETQYGEKYILSFSFKPLSLYIYDQKFRLVLSLPEDALEK